MDTFFKPKAVLSPQEKRKLHKQAAELSVKLGVLRRDTKQARRDYAVALSSLGLFNWRFWR